MISKKGTSVSITYLGLLVKFCATNPEESQDTFILEHHIFSLWRDKFNDNRSFYPQPSTKILSTLRTAYFQFNSRYIADLQLPLPKS